MSPREQKMLAALNTIAAMRDEPYYRSRTAKEALQDAHLIAFGAIAEVEQASTDGWIPWAGGECPLNEGTEHFVRLRNGEEYGPDRDPEGWRWSHNRIVDDIIAYRVVGDAK